MAKITDKQIRFCLEYIKDLNATQAYIRAGYSPNGASQGALTLLSKVEVSDYIAQLKLERNERTEIDADYVLRQLKSFQQAEVRELFNDNGTAKPVCDWPQHWQRMVDGIDVSEQFMEDGTLERKLKIKFMPRAAINKMLGDHIQVGAFASQHITGSPEGFADRMKRAEQRVVGSNDPKALPAPEQRH